MHMFFALKKLWMHYFDDVIKTNEVEILKSLAIAAAANSGVVDNSVTVHLGHCASVPNHGDPLLMILMP